MRDRNIGVLVMIISVFNNKGGVGKTTLVYHLGHALASLGKKVLLCDLDPQCNLSINALSENMLSKIWGDEEAAIRDLNSARKKNPKLLKNVSQEYHSIHYLLKPVQDGVDNIIYSKPVPLDSNIDLIPGRLSLQFYEHFLSSRWAETFIGAPHALRAVSGIYNLIKYYQKKYKYDFVLVDTSPSLGDLNKIVVSLSDYFFIPCSPDIFSIYGIRNIGASLSKWKKDFVGMFSLLQTEQRSLFPENLVKLLGFSLYKAQQRNDAKNYLKLPKGHYTHAIEIPKAIMDSIEPADFAVSEIEMKKNIGETAIVHTHNTMVGMAQKYHVPIWKVPSVTNLEKEDISTINPNKQRYEGTKDAYQNFAKALIQRIPNAR